MAEKKSSSVKAIQLAKTVFESINGNLGLLKFNIEELTPITTSITPTESDSEPKEWIIICSFFESLGSVSPSRYQAIVNLNDNIVSIKKLDTTQLETEKKYKVEPITEEKESEQKKEEKAE